MFLVLFLSIKLKQEQQKALNSVTDAPFARHTYHGLFK